MFKIEEKKLEFMKYALDHAERRIQLMDQKASILMAIQVGFYVFVVTILKDVVGIFEIGATNEWMQIATNIFLFIGLIITFHAVYLLIMTIRPKNGLFQKEMRLDKYTIENPMFWFPSGRMDSEQYSEQIDGLSEFDMGENIKQAHFTSLQLLKRKYDFYRKATESMNFLIIYNSIGMLALLLWTMLV